jgi:hypothetical protein
MLKKALNWVLGSSASSTYPRRYACGAAIISAFVKRLFDHPPILIVRVLKTVANFVLSSPQSSTYPTGKERVLARLGRVGEKVYASGCYSPVALLDDDFEHPPKNYMKTLTKKST